MDWSRAKSYLILTFLLLDIVMGYQYWRIRSEQAGYVQSYSEQLAEVKQLFASQNWKLQTEVPKDTPELGLLHVKRQSVDTEAGKEPTQAGGTVLYKDEAEIRVSLNNPVSLDFEEAAAGDKVGSLMAAKIRSDADYRFDRKTPYGKGSGFLRYLPWYEGYPIFSAPLDVYVQDNQVTQYRQTLLAVIGEGGTKKQVLSSVHALRSLSESIDKFGRRSDNRVIRDIRLGYYSKPFHTEEWFLAPVWRIESDQEIFYVNALTGEVEMEH
ncbi:two-component system regulatory protein YycI [Effusibacillus dendaii]|uniref:Regulatory protein YycH-like domain-containing protein n=1 Tax=Effusibacillus dendaii TaxID=2743772 RepID=A0A7I8DF02_9BACL|nr:two-component system regulatory protein YycI [Effusibacillus dendaii]BCJ87529.1 hypothetical protein skT53_25140 [Effusibacillus dendaii]